MGKFITAITCVEGLAKGNVEYVTLSCEGSFCMQYSRVPQCEAHVFSSEEEARKQKALNTAYWKTEVIDIESVCEKLARIEL